MCVPRGNVRIWVKEIYRWYKMQFSLLTSTALLSKSSITDLHFILNHNLWRMEGILEKIESKYFENMCLGLLRCTYSMHCWEGRAIVFSSQSRTISCYLPCIQGSSVGFFLVRFLRIQMFLLLFSIVKPHSDLLQHTVIWENWHKTE